MAAERTASVTGRAEIEIGASPQVVWEVLTRLENWPDWNSDVKWMRVDGPIAPGTEFRWKAGPGTIVSKIDRVESPRYISWHGRTLTIDAYHEWWLEPRDSGAFVRTEEAFFGMLARLLKWPLQKKLDKSFADALERLKRAAERQAGSSG
jgi:uncharacterized protein YndB with AHSA1/START domain